jgi:hypothetical protein
MGAKSKDSFYVNPDNLCSNSGKNRGELKWVY